MEDPKKVIEGEENTVTLSKEEHENLVAEKTKLSQDKNQLVSEIKEIRKDKSLSEEQVKDLVSKIEELKANKESNPNLDVEELAKKTVQEFYDKREAETREGAKQTAMSKFLSDNPEFSPENDEAGLKKAAFESKLSRFNLSEITKEEDFLSVYNDALNLIGVKKEVNESGTSIDVQPNSNPKPAEAKIDSLTSKELKVIEESMGGDKEKFLKMKVKHPDFIADLMENVK